MRKNLKAEETMSLNNNISGIQQQEVNVTLRRHPEMGFGWEVSLNAAHDGCYSAFGFDTLQEMFSSLDFIRMLQKNLGTDSVPENVVKYAQRFEEKNAVSFDDELVSKIIKMMGDGVKVIDNRVSKNDKPKK